MTDSMKHAIEETNRRRRIQSEYNQEHGIEPKGIVKQVKDLTERVRPAADSKEEYRAGLPLDMPKREAEKLIAELEKQMRAAAQEWEFEKAALLRDQILELRAAADALDSRPEWKKVMEDESHHEIEELREQKANELKAKSIQKDSGGRSRRGKR
jgi:excinuclease ABC subunit B